MYERTQTEFWTGVRLPSPPDKILYYPPWEQSVQMNFVKNSK